jgi:hypothetical protein
LTLLSHSPSLSVCHSEDVISSHSSIDSAVARNWVSEWWSLLLVVDYSEKCFLCLLEWLSAILLAWTPQGLQVLGLGQSWLVFFICSLIWQSGSKECVNLRGRNRLW